MKEQLHKKLRVKFQVEKGSNRDDWKLARILSFF